MMTAQNWYAVFLIGAMHNLDEIPSWMGRTELLIGAEGVARLKRAHVLVVGIGGVGSFAAEALVRAGIGKMTLVDADTVDATNRNRQLTALLSTQGELKTSVMAARLRDINPNLDIMTHPVFLKEDCMDAILSESYDYVVDAIDSLSPKAFLIASAFRRNIPIVVSLGSAGKMDPSLIRVVMLSETHGCPLARALRQRLKKMEMDLSQIESVFSPEVSGGACAVYDEHDALGKKSARGTISYLPPMFGLFAASVVIRRLLNG